MRAEMRGQAQCHTSWTSSSKCKYYLSNGPRACLRVRCAEDAAHSAPPARRPTGQQKPQRIDITSHTLHKAEMAHIPVLLGRVRMSPGDRGSSNFRPLLEARAGVRNQGGPLRSQRTVRPKRPGSAAPRRPVIQLAADGAGEESRRHALLSALYPEMLG